MERKGSKESRFRCSRQRNLSNHVLSLSPIMTYGLSNDALAHWAISVITIVSKPKVLGGLVQSCFLFNVSLMLISISYKFKFWVVSNKLNICSVFSQGSLDLEVLVVVEF